jgi:arsenate reductase (glutaredoxin)
VVPTDPDAPAPLRLYVLATCGTCRKAMAWLASRGIGVEPIDITLQPPCRDELKAALDQFGGPSRLFNTSGKSYRALGAAAVKAMNDEQALDALAADGRLIKRPFLVTPSGRITTGFRIEEWEELLASSPSP